MRAVDALFGKIPPNTGGAQHPRSKIPARAQKAISSDSLDLYGVSVEASRDGGFDRHGEREHAAPLPGPEDPKSIRRLLLRALAHLRRNYAPPLAPGVDL